MKKLGGGFVGDIIVQAVLILPQLNGITLFNDHRL